MSDPVLVERYGARGELVLNRPERKNAVNGPLIEAFRAGLRELVEDETIRTIVFRGAGGVFSSGLDLKDMNADPRPAWTSTFSETRAALQSELYACPKALVCAVESYAINAGVVFALAADFLVIGSDAFLQVGEVRQGVAAPLNLALLAMKVPRPVINRVVLLGHRLPGDEVVRLGLAHRAVPGSEVLAEARALADEIGEFPPEGVRSTKAVLNWLEAQGATEAAFAEVTAVAARHNRRGPLPSLKQSPGS